MPRQPECFCGQCPVCKFRASDAYKRALENAKRYRTRRKVILDPLADARHEKPSGFMVWSLSRPWRAWLAGL